MSKRAVTLPRIVLLLRIMHVAALCGSSPSKAEFKEQRRKSSSAREETRPERQAAAGAKQYKFSYVVHSDFPRRFETAKDSLTEVRWASLAVEENI